MANSRKACKHCKEYFAAEGMIKTPRGTFCTMSHAIEWANNKARAVVKKEKRKKHLEDKQRIKTKSELISEAQRSFNRYIRARDFFDPCISCGKSRELVDHEQGWKHGGAWDAGHYRSRGAAKQLRFNLLNCHKQCKGCNAGSAKFEHKRELVKEGYINGLTAKIGSSRVEALDNNSDLENDTREKLERIKRIFNKRARWYEKRNSLKLSITNNQ